MSREKEKELEDGLLISEIEMILRKVLPSKTHFIVAPYKVMGSTWLKIMFAVSDVTINRVAGQFPQVVSLRLDLADLELEPQVFGGNGGQHIYREIDPNDPKERFYAMQSIKIPFRKPKKEKKFVLITIQRFAENWLKALTENKDRLMYQDLINYDEFLKS